MHSNSANQQAAANPMIDPLGFIRQLWGSMQVPGMVAPPMSVDELDKKIQDLKTVESWLTVNMNMLRGTIQTLEVQRATMAALQSIGESFAQHAEQARAGQFGAAEQSTGAASTAGGWSGWPMPGFGSRAETEPAASSEPAPEPVPEPVTEPVTESAPDPAAADAAEREAQQSAKSDAADSMGASPGSFANPAAWWNLLQDQFKQAVSQAVQSEQPAPPQKFAAGSTRPPAAKAAAGASKGSKATGKKNAARSVAKPAAKAVSKPASKAVSKPAAKPASKAASKSAVASVAKAVAKSPARAPAGSSASRSKA